MGKVEAFEEEVRDRLEVLDARDKGAAEDVPDRAEGGHPEGDEDEDEEPEDGP